MKKVSTAAAKQVKNISEQKLTIGLHLGDRSSWARVKRDSGEGSEAIHQGYADGKF
jgi:hypothetical protein